MPSDLQFEDLRMANAKRVGQFKNRRGEPAHAKADGSDWSIAEWTNAIAGEVGEACNLAKKLRRGDFGPRESQDYILAMHELARELADVVIYADLAAQQLGWSLADAIIEKFNEKSNEVQSDVFLRYWSNGYNSQAR